MIKCEECGKVFQFKSHLKRYQTYSSCAKIVPKPEQPRLRSSTYLNASFFRQPIYTQAIVSEPIRDTPPPICTSNYTCTFDYASSFYWVINP